MSEMPNDTIEVDVYGETPLGDIGLDRFFDRSSINYADDPQTLNYTGSRGPEEVVAASRSCVEYVTKPDAVDILADFAKPLLNWLGENNIDFTYDERELAYKFTINSYPVKVSLDWKNRRFLWNDTPFNYASFDEILDYFGNYINAGIDFPFPIEPFNPKVFRVLCDDTRLISKMMGKGLISQLNSWRHNEMPIFVSASTRPFIWKYFFQNT